MFAFAWNPLILLETAQNGHNDIVMIFLMLAAVWALTANRSAWVMPLLAVSVQIKYISIFIAPLFLLYLTLNQPTWRIRLRFLLIHGLLFALLVGLPLLPLWPGLENWAVLTLNSGAGRSALALSVLALSAWFDLNAIFDLSRLALHGLFLAIWLQLLWQNRQQFSRPRTTIFLAWALFFWYLLLAVPVFHAWYLLWSLPLAVLLLPDRIPLQATILFSLTALLIIPYFETIRIWYPALLQNHLLGHAIGVPLLILPPAMVALRRELKTAADHQPLMAGQKM
jgi:hypothetical protein